MPPKKKTMPPKPVKKETKTKKTKMTKSKLSAPARAKFIKEELEYPDLF